MIMAVEQGGIIQTLLCLSLLLLYTKFFLFYAILDFFEMVNFSWGKRPFYAIVTCVQTYYIIQVINMLILV